MKKVLTVILISITMISTLTSGKAINLAKHEHTILKEDPYEKICFVFIGKPSKVKVQPLLEATMKKFNLSITDENVMKAASCVLSLRKTSVVGVTEMEILKHMYQKGSTKISFPNQAAISFTLLETNK